MSEFIKKQKALYKSLKPCFCPALREYVHFTSTGLNHLLYNRRRPRNPRERHYRAALIPCLNEVIGNAPEAIKNVIPEDPNVTTWSLQHSCVDDKGEKRTVKVILIKEGKGKLCFLSAMKRKRRD